MNQSDPESPESALEPTAATNLTPMMQQYRPQGTGAGRTYSFFFASVLLRTFRGGCRDSVKTPRSDVDEPR